MNQTAHQHLAQIHWDAGMAADDITAFSRNHRVSFPGGQGFAASSAAAFGGSENHVDPEQMLAASLASCHMLTFLALAAKFGHRVASYRDEPFAIIGRNDEGRQAVSEITLRPRVEFSGEKIPDAQALAKLHQSAHKYCFIANSTRCKVNIAS